MAEGSQQREEIHKLREKIGKDTAALAKLFTAEVERDDKHLTIVEDTLMNLLQDRMKFFHLVSDDTQDARQKFSELSEEMRNKLIAEHLGSQELQILDDDVERRYTASVDNLLMWVIAGLVFELISATEEFGNLREAMKEMAPRLQRLLDTVQQAKSGVDLSKEQGFLLMLKRMAERGVLA